MEKLTLENMDILIASDHRGFELKKLIINKLGKNKNILDLGPYVFDINDDYPDYALKVGNAISDDITNNSCGILICGSGNGMIIGANRFKSIRAILAYNEFVVEMGRKHNNSNVLVIPADIVDFDNSIRFIKTWMFTPFSNEERHTRRLNKLENIIS